jgi:hypothetical protein
MASNFLSKFLPGGKVMYKMDSRKRNDLPSRNKTPVSYAESEDSMTSSSFQTPPSQRQEVIDLDAEEVDDEEDEDEGEQEDKQAAKAEEDSIQYSAPAQRRAGLRAPKKNLSLKAQENVNASLDRK